MPKPFDPRGSGPYFEGWYCKQQNDRETVALIPALHISEAGERTASLQVITDEAAYHIPLPAWSLGYDPKERLLRLGDCRFSPQGCRLPAGEPGGSAALRAPPPPGL